VSPFLIQLAALCRDQPARTKWLFVPAHGQGHTITELLVRAGTAWTNLRVTTPLDVALAMAAPPLVAHGIDPTPESLGPALVTRLLLDLPDTAPSYFRFLAHEPRMAEALWRTIRELRLAGGAAAGLTASAFTDPAKHAALRMLVSTYENYLARHRLADGADVYREALGQLDTCPVGAGDLRLELPGSVWAPLERRFLDALPGTAPPSHALAVSGLGGSRIAGTRGARTAAVAPAPRSDAERLAFLMDPAAAPPPHGDGTLKLFHAAGREAEIEEVLRRILDGDRRLDDVEIVCATSDQVALLWDKAASLRLPITLAAGLPARLTRPARALFAFLSWATDRFAAGALRRLLQSGNVKLAPGGGLSPGEAARLLARSTATWERHTYRPALTALADDLESRAADPEEDAATAAACRRRAAHARELAVAIEELLALVPESDAGGNVPLGRIVDGCRRFLGGHTVVAGDLDSAALAALDATLADLLVLGDLLLRFGDAARLIRDHVARIAVGSSRARPGHLHVASLSVAGLSGRSCTFVVGLEETGVFPPMLEDPILLDDERARLRDDTGIDLPTSHDRTSETLHEIVGRLADLGGHVCLSYSCLDLREGRETFPSWLLLQAHRLLCGRPDATYADLQMALGDPVTAVPATTDQALNDGRWWLATLKHTGRSGVSAVEEVFPAVARGAAAEASRSSEAFTVHDGLVTLAGLRLDPRTSGDPISPTRLEKLALCPYRHFLERGLGLAPLDDVAPEPGRWLDPGTRGKLLHELFAVLLRELRARGETPDPARHGARALALAQEKLGELRAHIPPPSDHVYRREAEAVLRDVDLFLREEAAHPERRPLGLEVAFGVGATDGEPLGQTEPIVVDLGPGLRFGLCGRIDRIDRLADGTYEVVDYKTGKPFLPGGVHDAHFGGGRQLQHALYALAAQRLLGRVDPTARVASSSYYFPSEQGGGERARRRPTAPSELAAVMGDLMAVIASGAFVHTDDDGDCSFCELRTACGPDAVRRAKAKIKNSANGVLEPFRRLRSHE
jgi:RecB family exonuclease